MRVSLLSFDFGESIVPLAAGLSEFIDVQLVIPEQELNPHLSDLKAAVKVVPFSKPRYRQPVRQLTMLAGIHRTIRSFRPDLIHLQQGHLWFNPTLHALGRTPLLVTVHDPQPHPGDRGGQKTPQRVIDLAFRRADRMIAHAESVKRMMTETRGVDPAAIDVIPLSFGTRPLAPADLAPHRRVVLFFGRIWPYKGLEYLIEAQPLVSAAVGDAVFVIAGGGEDLQTYARRIHDPSRFRLCSGFVSVEQRERLFEEASVVVLPYIEATQTGVIPLAYRHAKPVVATTVGGLPEVVRDGETGYLVPPRDPVALADAIIRLLTDEDRRQQMAGHARSYFDDVFDNETTAERTLNSYRRLLSQQPARRRTAARPVRH